MVAAVGTRASQALVLAAAIYPASGARASQALVEAAIDANGAQLRASQALVLVAALGRTDDPHVRLWTCTIDGHDLVFFRLGNTETLVADLGLDPPQWYKWGSGDSDLWRAYTGINWQGGRRLGSTSGTNVVVGDDGNGSIYMLDMQKSYDDDALEGSANPRTFLRTITGQIATKSFDAIPCFGVQLIGSAGESLESALTAVTLYTSDDLGHTYDAHDTLTIDNANYAARAEWWSLGSFTAPGRLFRVEDYGAFHRIDFLEMIEPPGDEE